MWRAATGHRVPGIVSFPPLVGERHWTSWQTATTMDLLPTVVELLGNVSWPAAQRDWARDGASIVPLLRGAAMPPRGLGWAYMSIDNNESIGYRHARRASNAASFGRAIDGSRARRASGQVRQVEARGGLDVVRQARLPRRGPAVRLGRAVDRGRPCWQHLLAAVWRGDESSDPGGVHPVKGNGDAPPSDAPWWEGGVGG